MNIVRGCTGPGEGALDKDQGRESARVPRAHLLVLCVLLCARLECVVVVLLVLVPLPCEAQALLHVLQLLMFQLQHGLQEPCKC